MNTYFLDTSALVKRYIVETGTMWLRTLATTNKGNIIIVSRIAEVEAMSAVARRQREGNFDLTVASGIRNLLRQHFATSYTVIDVNSVITQSSIDLLLHHPLRTYDAVQLASAILVNQRLQSNNMQLTFLCADTRLRNIAQAEGLVVDDPNQY
jgi:uncharacterized protein